MLSSLRTVKDAGEIALLRKAVDASAAAHVAAMKAVKPNVKEYEISALMQFEWDKRGCERPSYGPDRWFGPQLHRPALFGQHQHHERRGRRGD